MLSRIFTAAFLSRLDALTLRMGPLSGGQLGGARRSRARGASVEFADFRDYAPGDDVRRVDWNAFGRLSRLYVKLFLEEREASVNVILDASASMAVGEPSKAEFAKAMAAVCCYLALSRHDRLRLFAVTEGKAHELYKGTGKTGFHGVLAALEACEMRGDSRLSTALRGTELPSGGLTVLISDLFVQDDWLLALRLLRARRQDIALLHILAHDEAEPDLDGWLKLTDSEGGVFDTQVDEATRNAYLRELETFRREIEAGCRQYGASCAFLTSNMAVETVALGLMARAGAISSH